VVHIVDMPIKCPVAPLEFTFLADAHFRQRGMRDRVELVYATPLSGAFTKPIASRHLGSMLDERKIALESDFLAERVEDRTLVSYDEREIDFDLLVTVPLNMGAYYLARSGLGDELNLVPVDKHTLLSKAHDNDSSATGPGRPAGPSGRGRQRTDADRAVEPYGTSAYGPSPPTSTRTCRTVTRRLTELVEPSRLVPRGQLRLLLGIVVG
jgi:hypothetical protein